MDLKEKKQLFKKQNSKKGITLIALVITIIVLLILAGVSIATLTGDNGVLTKATQSKRITNEAEEKEGLELAVTSSKMEDVNTLKITEEKLSDAIKQQFGNNKDFSITDNGDGSFLVSMNETQRIYYIDETGEIIDQSKMLKISTADELKAFRDDVNSGNTYEGKYVYLIDDITLNSSEEWEPIGTNENGFRGNFFGNNKSITLSIDSQDDNIGFFSINYGNIYSLNILGNIVGNDFVAGVVAKNYGNVVNCSNNANIQSSSTADNPYIGGIVGKSFEGSIFNCYNNGNIVQSRYSIGGITGGADNTIVKNCYNSGEITGYGQVGGVVGRISEATILNCYNTGEIISNNGTSGGIVGESVYSTTSIIKSCYNVGNINGNSNTGGICGSINGTTIENCYNLANVIGNGTTGGVVGNGKSTIIKECYHKGNISGKSEQKPNAFEGGIAGASSSADNLNMCKWCSNTIEYAVGSLKITDGYTVDLEMPDILSIINNEKAFKQDTNNINNGYPILQWQ